MNAIELFTQSGKSTGFFICGKCRMVTLNPLFTFNDPKSKNTREAAEECCRPKFCVDCKVEVKPVSYSSDGQYRCDDCRNAEYRRKEDVRRAKELENATEVEYDGGMVNCPEISSNDGWFESLDALYDHIHDSDSESRPEWCHPATPELRMINFKSAIERELEQIHEDGYEDMDVQMDKELEAAIDACNARHERELTVWHMDTSKKIRIQPESPPQDTQDESPQEG